MFKNMTKTQKVLFWVVTSVILLAVLGVGLFYWKKNKDIKDMKTTMYNSLSAFCNTTADRQKTADCVVDKTIQKYGYLQTKEQFFEGDDNTATDEDNEKFKAFQTTCLSENNCSVE